MKKQNDASNILNPLKKIKLTAYKSQILVQVGTYTYRYTMSMERNILLTSISIRSCKYDLKLYNDRTEVKIYKQKCPFLLFKKKIN